MEPWVAYQEVPKYIMAADICILPAHKNDIMMNIVPIKVYEYMAAGKPVIATNLPGLMKEFGRGRTAFSMRSRPTRSSIERWSLSRQGDLGPEGKRARNFVKSLSWDELTDVFQQTLSRGCLVDELFGMLQRCRWLGLKKLTHNPLRQVLE